MENEGDIISRYTSICRLSVCWSHVMKTRQLIPQEETVKDNVVAYEIDGEEKTVELVSSSPNNRTTEEIDFEEHPLLREKYDYGKKLMTVFKYGKTLKYFLHLTIKN